MNEPDAQSGAWGIPVHPQRQDSLSDQLADLHIAAVRLGMYDAADWLWKHSLVTQNEDSGAAS